MRVFKNARIVGEFQSFTGSLVERDGVVVAVRNADSGDDVSISLSGDTPPEAVEIVDCRGLLLLPGGVDVHTHCNDPGLTAREDFCSATAAAAAGGMTTLVDMPVDNQPPPIHGTSFAGKRCRVENRIAVDVALWGGLVTDNVAHLADMAAAGAAGFKAFMTPADELFPWTAPPVLLRGMREAARLGKPVLVHAEDPTLCVEGRKVCLQQGRSSADDFMTVHSPAAEHRAVRTALELAAQAGCWVHICHASSAEAVLQVAAAKRSGVRATVETCPHYLVFSAEDMRKQPNFMKCAPPLPEPAAREALWERLLAGDIDLISSDHSPCEPEEKAATLSIWDAWGGLNSVQATMQVLYSEGVIKRGLPAEQLVQLLCAGPARLAGLYPQKGSLSVGADADFVLLNPQARWTFTPQNWFSKHSCSPYMGFSGQGRVESTWLRGTRIFSRNPLEVKPGCGRYVPVRNAS